MADIFISYKKERRAHAERLAAVLEAHGYEVWWDYELAVGPDFRDQIEAKLEVSRLVIVLWCSGAVKSKFVRSEASRADKRGKLIQAYLEWGIEPPLGFEEAQGQPLVNWTGEPDGERLSGLLVALAERLGERRRSENVIRLIEGLPALPAVEPILAIEEEEADVADGPSSSTVVMQPTDHAPAATSGSASRWALIDKSLDIRDYDDFIKVFKHAEEVFDARRHRRQLEDWNAVDHASSKAIEGYLREALKGAGLFGALEKHARDSMRRAAEAELKARQVRELAKQAKAKGEAWELLKWEKRLGPEVGRAAWAAKAGKPVVERMFPVELPDVEGWPVPQMVAIPPGRFLMGAAEGEEGADYAEYPQHEVTIEYPFALGQHALTFAEWDTALAAGAGVEKPGDEGWGRGSRPVIDVSWEDAKAYLAWLNQKLGLEGQPDEFRLPSEAEWEYACRAGTQTPFSFGDTITPKQANYDGNLTYSSGQRGTYHGKTMPVGFYPANAFGLHEMHGNVWEWCADTWRETYDGAPADGPVWMGGDDSQRVLRGGCWSNGPEFLRSASRYCAGPSDRRLGIGVRLARTL